MPNRMPTRTALLSAWDASDCTLAALLNAIGWQGGTSHQALAEIRTANDCPPIPTRELDWSAWIDGQEERGCHTGSTEKEAIAALLESIT